MIPNVDKALADSLSAATSPSQQVEALFNFMRSRGGSFYDESVTQLEHALQAGHLARESQAAPEQITAALLHDVGHFLMDEHSDFLTDDWVHETIGADYIVPFFRDAVTEPIRLHVAAKRYLCTVDVNYFDGLSRASQRSFRLQGGGMSPSEVAEFEGNPFHSAAVLLRRWDDGAKLKGWDVPDLDEYREEMATSLRPIGN